MRSQKNFLLFFSLSVLFYTAYLETSFASKKDFKGLFGSYRREKFTENEARSSSFGIDLNLSSLFPFIPLVKTTEDLSVGPKEMYYSTFFNGEIALSFSFAYRYETFLSIGYYTYETRRQNAASSTTVPVFHLFEMTSYPILLGIRYRFSESDFVPYLGVAAGYAYSTRKGIYETNTNIGPNISSGGLIGQAQAGVEFFISAKTGIRLEVALYYMQLSKERFQSSAEIRTNPIFDYQENIMALRYASGLFVLL